jgi:hypothetical protein
MASYFASFLCKISSEASPTVEIMKSKSSTMSTFCIFGLLYLEFFCNEGFVGETFLFVDGSVSSGRFYGVVTLPCLSSSCSFSFFFTSSSPPPLGDSDGVSFDVLCTSCTSCFFFFLLLLGESYSSRVTTVFPMRLGSDSSVGLVGIRSSTCQSLMISSRSSVVSL